MKAPVVTGAGAVTALGRGLFATRSALAEGKSALAPVPRQDGAVPRHASPAGRIGAFATDPELPRSKARRLDLGSQYAVVAARQCLAAAGYEMKGREERTGILLGTGSAGAGPLTEFERQMAADSPENASPFLFPYTVANAPASVVAIELGIQGPNVTLIHKDPAPLNALFYGRMALADSRADALLVGAADEWNLVYHEVYERLRVTRSDLHPGFALGEGAALLLVETEEAALARGARPWARVSGVVMRPSAICPHRRRAEPAALAEAMRAALADAGLAPADVGLVHLSADGVPWMDAAEREALATVFGDNRPPTAEVKSQLGENPAIVAVQMAIASAELRDEPSLGCVLVNAFGAGGNFLSLALTAA